jgi:dihydrodipicolinate synthase/N-acetylneuraminate lyase
MLSGYCRMVKGVNTDSAIALAQGLEDLGIAGLLKPPLLF